MAISRETEIARRIETWFEHDPRPLPWRRHYDPWHVWVAEIMAQQTRMEVVVRRYEPFIERFPDPAALAESSEDEVLAAWSGLGYYRRAKLLRAGARFVCDHLGGEVPSAPEDLLRIPGIGRYTAGAIASIAFDARAAIVDGNVKRLLSRVEALEAPADSSVLARQCWELSTELVAATASPRNLNQGMMELGALVCRPRNPRCDECPLNGLCLARARMIQHELPRAPRSRGAVRLHIPLFIIDDRSGRILMRREAGPLMESLFHLPHGTEDLVASHGLHPHPVRRLGSVRHTITNRRIEFEVWLGRLPDSVREDSADTRWVHPDELHGIPHPSYVAKAIRLARDALNDDRTTDSGRAAELTTDTDN